MKSLNQVQLIGNLTKDPELRQTASGNSVASFSLALNRSVKNGENWDEAVEFVDCVAFGKQAETIQTYVSKGQKLYVQGRIQTRTYETSNGKGSKTEVVVNEIVFMDSKGKTQDTVLEDITDGEIDLSMIPDFN